MQNLKRGKKSQGHLELILSFVIFVGFTFVIFIFLNPLRQPQVNYSNLDDLQKGLLNYTSIQYQEVPFIINSSLVINPGVNAFSITSPFNVNSVLVKNSSEDIINSKVDAGKIIFQNSNNLRYYTVYFSPYFNNYTSVACAGSHCLEIVSMAQGSFGAVTYEKLPLYENFFILNKTYMEDYSNFAKSLGINGNFEFTLYTFPGKKVIINDSLSKFKIKSSNILSRDILLKSIDKNAVQHDVLLNIRMWG